MKKSLFVGSTLVGLMMLSAAPALADDTTTTVVQPGVAPVVVQQRETAAAPVVVNSSGRDEGVTRGPSYALLTWGGVGIWGVGYSAAVITAAVADDACDASSGMCLRGSGVLFVPVVGPFIALAAVEGKAPTTAKALLAIDGAFQLGGVVMAVSGLVLGAAEASRTRQAKEPKVLVYPVVSQSTLGVGAGGRF